MLRSRKYSHCLKKNSFFYISEKLAWASAALAAYAAAFKQSAQILHEYFIDRLHKNVSSKLKVRQTQRYSLHSQKQPEMNAVHRVRNVSNIHNEKIVSAFLFKKRTNVRHYYRTHTAPQPTSTSMPNKITITKVLLSMPD